MQGQVARPAPRAFNTRYALCSSGDIPDVSIVDAATPEKARPRVDALKDSVRAIALDGFTRHQLPTCTAAPCQKWPNTTA